jgi:hypothetical protein
MGPEPAFRESKRQRGSQIGISVISAMVPVLLLSQLKYGEEGFMEA